MEHLQSQLRVLEETLGLQIQQVPDKGLLRFVFVHLDPCDPPRPFSFTLQLTGQSTYVVHDCAPPVSRGPAAGTRCGSGCRRSCVSTAGVVVWAPGASHNTPPPAPSQVADLPALLGALSHNPNHFFSFVRGMRKAFKAGLLHG